MKTNTEALFDALAQIDNGQLVDVDEESIAIDGRFEREPLDGALNTHLVPLASISKQQEPDALFLRETWATGTTGDGREFEVSRTGVTLILAIGKFGTAERETHTITLTDLAPAWLRAVGASGDE